MSGATKKSQGALILPEVLYSDKDLESSDEENTPFTFVESRIDGIVDGRPANI